MTTLSLIGIGTGNPDHLTGQAKRAIAEADLILIPHKGRDKSDLADLRQCIVAKIRPTDDATALFRMPVRDPALSYLDAVEDWHDEIARIWAEKIEQNPKAETVALLVWGDPSLYDSTLRIAARILPMPRIEVVPGLTSLQILTAAHAIPLNTVGGAVVITTGRRLRENGWPDGADTVVVMLDGNCAFQTLNATGIDVWWGAFLGMPEQILKTGPLKQTGPDIIKTRAAARASHGWIMDIYLLRRRPV
ncbi:MAG: precorrin-6A synthase (deacetylating) [Paracoccaceae bacterium]